MDKMTYQVIYRSGEVNRELIKDITQLKVEGGAYLFYSDNRVIYSVPVDVVKEIISQ